jgi:non-heme chloroperoxidase
MPFLEHKGASLHYEVERGLFPQDMLFIHGNLASNIWWSQSIAEWKKTAQPEWKGRAVFAEWRGYGSSSAPNVLADLSIERLAIDNLAIVEFLQLKKPGLVGHSMGGGIALQATLNSPECFSSALLLNPVPSSGYHSTPKQLEMVDRMRVDRQVCFTVMATTIFNAHKLHTEVLEQVADAAFHAAPMNWRGVAEETMIFNLHNELGRIRIPVLVVHGVEDHICRLSDSQATVDRIPGAQLMPIFGAGHSLNLEDPAKFACIVRDYFSKPI